MDKLYKGTVQTHYSIDLLSHVATTVLPVTYRLFRWSKPKSSEQLRAVLVDMTSPYAKTYVKGFQIWRQNDMDEVKYKVWWRFRKKAYKVKYRGAPKQ